MIFDSSMQENPLRIFQLQLDHLINIFGQSGGKDHRLSIPIDLLQNMGQRVQKAHFENHIRFVHHQHLHVVAVEAETVLEMLEKASRSRDHDVHELHSFLLIFEILATD